MCKFLSESKTDRAFGGGGVDDMIVLGDDDLVLDDETAGGGSCWFDQGLPVSAIEFFFFAGIACYQLRGFGRADSFGFVSVGGALGEECEDGLLEFDVGCGGFLIAAGFAAELYDVPVLSPLLLEGERAAAGLADLFFAWGWAVGFGFAVGHCYVQVFQGEPLVAGYDKNWR
jgi:hypothetical protein